MGNRMLDWDKLKTFRAIAKIGSFSAAADYLSTSQSALSRSISSLESTLNMVLFYRNIRGLKLTPAGQFLYDVSTEIGQKISAAEIYLQSLQDKFPPLLRIATSKFLSSLWLPLKIGDFAEKNPELRLSILSVNGDINLRTHEGDIAIRPHYTDDNFVEAVHITDFHIQIYADEQYIKNHGMPEKFKDLSKSNILGILDPQMFVKDLSNFKLLSEVSSHKHFMLAGGGKYHNDVNIIVAPQELVGGLNKELTQILPNYEDKIEIYLIYPKALKDVKQIKSIEGFFKANFKDLKASYNILDQVKIVDNKKEAVKENIR